MENNKINIVFDPYEMDIIEKAHINELMDYSVIISEIANALIKYRQSLQITQKQLAKELNMRQSMISKLESGDYNPTFKMLLKISYKLEKNSNFFLDVIENIRKRIEKTIQYKECKNALKYSDFKTNNRKYSSNVVFIYNDLIQNKRECFNKDGYKYKVNMQ